MTSHSYTGSGTPLQYPNPSRFGPANRKIDPSKLPRVPMGTPFVKPDGTPLDENRLEIGPTALAFKEWERDNITPPNLDALRQYRLSRVVEQINARDLAGVLLFDPINIRYASDASSMQVWTLHNASRACYVSPVGHVILWDFVGCEHMSAHLPLVKEVRMGAGCFYFVSGNHFQTKANEFVQQIVDILKEHAPANRRLAVDKIEIPALTALQRQNIDVQYGQEVMEEARIIKNENEINAMKCAIHVCETSMRKMQEAITPGMTEVDAWGIMQYENTIRGGEWIEARILTSGPRTNPWFQECGPRVMQNGEFLAFDTDMISAYGYCADISRTWMVGDKKPSDAQRKLYTEAAEFVEALCNAVETGMTLKQASLACPLIPEKYQEQRYAVLFHGVGLCDEYPEIRFQDQQDEQPDGTLLPGTVLCPEVYFGEVGADIGVKLEHQILITDNGPVKLSSYPLEDELLL